MGLFENRRQSNDGQHGKDKGLQETNDQAEIELPLSGYSLEEGRQKELEGMRKSIKFMREVLKIGSDA